MEIEQYLKSFYDEPIYYCPNPGNSGDSLIAHATFQIFKKNNINYQIINLNKFKPKNKILIYGGGGSLVNNYYGLARNIVETFHAHVKKLVILPHTINTHEDLLKKLGSNVEIICREEISYNYVKRLASRANVMLMDDLAFSLDVKDIFAQKPISFFKSFGTKIVSRFKKDEQLGFSVPSPVLMLQDRAIKSQKFIESTLNNGEIMILNCFRTDGEKTSIKIPRNNIDLSLKFNYGTKNEQLAFNASYELLNMINQYDKIRTNRLHLAIAGALLGKSVELYSNSYYKCKAIYEYSIKDRFTNVKWMG